jgi:hypothetical protein
MFVEKIKCEGFIINEYDRCTEHKVIDGKQCTITWYVDDVKVSHVYEKVVTKVIGMIESDFGDLSVVRGASHKLLGMQVDFNEDRTVSISTIDYVKEVIDSFPDVIQNKVTSPANRNVFNVDDESPLIDTKRAELFHSLVEKLLWIIKRGRPDIEVVISFLCTRVKGPTEEDWYKFKRVLMYLYGSINDVRIIGASDLRSLLCMVDASYSVHTNMRGHTGGLMSFGKGIIHGKSSKQKLNVKSYTESELVSLSEYIPYPLWMANFLDSQGYRLHENMVYQDNQSALKMENNGRNSCTGNSIHINISYFFVK